MKTAHQLNPAETADLREEVNKLLLAYTERRNKEGLKQGTFKWIIGGIKEYERIMTLFNIEVNAPIFSIDEKGILLFYNYEVKNWKVFLSILLVKSHIA